MSADTPDTHPRLHVFLASDAPLGVVLRRGPSAWSRMSLWHTDTDAIEHGQWIAGHVYERRCDISPDGALFAYFIFKATGGPDVSVDSWLAVSRPPWFSALALWEVGTTYCSGGLFMDAHTLRFGGMTDTPSIGALPPWLRLTSELPPYAASTPEWTSRHVYFNRLLRDGWIPVPSIDASEPSWERREPNGARVLSMHTLPSASFGTHGERHALEFGLQSEGDITPLGRATWADWDHRGRLIVAREGRLIEDLGHGEEREICDFDDQSPDPQPSPPEAHTWPSVAKR